MKRPETRSQALEVLERTHGSVIYPHVVETTHRGERTHEELDPHSLEAILEADRTSREVATNALQRWI